MEIQTANLNLNVNLAGKNVGLDLSTPVDNLQKSYQHQWAQGSGAEQVNQSWHDQRTLGVSASVTLDLAGSLTDAFGDTITYTGIKLLIIRNRSVIAPAAGAAADLEVGGAVNAFADWLGDPSDVVIVPAGGLLLLTNPSAAGWAVGAGGTDELKLTNASADNDCDLDIIIGGIV